MNFAAALSGIVVGASTVLIWIYAPITIGEQSLSNYIYEIVPGFVLSSIAIAVVSLMGDEPSDEIKSMFDVMVKRVREES